MVFPTLPGRRFVRAAAAVVAGKESVMRMKLAIATGAAAVVLGTGTAAYAVVTEGWMNPTTTGNVLPIDDNHSPTTTSPTHPVSPVATTAPSARSDDHGREAEPGDDHGREAEPGDDHGGRSTAAPSGAATSADDHGREPEPGDDGGRSRSTDDATHGGTGGGTDDGAGHH